MKKSTFVSNSPRATQALGSKIAKSILKFPIGKHAAVVSLEGDLGSGKTTFSQGFAKGLGIKQNVTSPTFVIVKPYKIRDTRYKLFYHIDCYRIHKPKELLDLGWKEILKNPRAIILIEWGDQVRRILPKDSIRIAFSHGVI
ncbi:MAG: tRNA (adenosine(37)-N6)-threonylcarbamoyltransferase complex ATPase subunit type 1 TsaE [Candidatus Wildermuthbacteria bacterium RIFCSPLOWO2_01_FULL_47_18]|uniref:tRNA threonylcarbamoyladenosine biosynthesis protein TsaE n=2 Tax=Candidatus Wildermuthiibacteriota TaxID=1817923 RepID=A0A1G2RGI3_9BACT|nr:MAG: tRNA (adenosine(37)-N6)-threonylcarbamoyltransferase complex ATPase subunit type 1 TsaE [Candidatus Wildermuthbacteria bacterium RIFCSPHIGHO2_02_FULL_48_16]OHA71964.1 MAG: tRNA (adenosine(37)-N6)-threonylcarbamoyltransferase complex ATPase subunit type 1 TsaE [Candidatus Wildermuthbacteria bacterium RIFCSPLOWO2_01_FULL_47_18]